MYIGAVGTMSLALMYDRFIIQPTERSLKDRSERATSGYAPSIADAESRNMEETSMSFTQFLVANCTGQMPPEHEMTTHQIVDKWGLLNLGRTSLILLGSMCASWALASEDLSFFE